MQASFWHLVWCVFHFVFWAWILAICKWVDLLVWRWALFKMSDSCKCQYDKAWHSFTQNSEALDENNKEHPISKVVSPKWWDQLIFCDTRLGMRISMAFSWPTAKLLLALVLQGRCSHNKELQHKQGSLVVSESHQGGSLVHLPGVGCWLIEVHQFEPIKPSTWFEILVSLLFGWKLWWWPLFLSLENGRGTKQKRSPWNGRAERKPPSHRSPYGSWHIGAHQCWAGIWFFNNDQLFRLFQKTWKNSGFHSWKNLKRVNNYKAKYLIFSIFEIHGNMWRTQLFFDLLKTTVMNSKNCPDNC